MLNFKRFKYERSEENINDTSLILIMLVAGSCSESFLEPNHFHSMLLKMFSWWGRAAGCSGQCSIESQNWVLHRSVAVLYQFEILWCSGYGTTDKATPWQDFEQAKCFPTFEDIRICLHKIGWYWDQSYYVIKDCNTVISRIDNAQFTSEASKNALLRGWHIFWEAFRYYSKDTAVWDVPLVLEEVTTPRVIFLQQPKESIWKKMIKDLEFAYCMFRKLLRWPGDRSQKPHEAPPGKITILKKVRWCYKFYYSIINSGVHTLTHNAWCR